MTREQLISTLDQISVRCSELYTKEQNEGLTKDEIEDSLILREWLDELAVVEVTN